MLVYDFLTETTNQLAQIQNIRSTKRNNTCFTKIPPTQRSRKVVRLVQMNSICFCTELNGRMEILELYTHMLKHINLRYAAGAATTNVQHP